MDKWETRGLGIAKEVASWSSDPSTQLGAVAFSTRNRILATGWNGFPRGIEETEERLNNRELKYKHVVHAEMNVIYNATSEGVSLDGSTLYIYGLPCCAECAKGVIQVGIKKVICFIPRKSMMRTEWQISGEEARIMFNEAGVESQWRTIE